MVTGRKSTKKPLYAKPTALPIYVVPDRYTEQIRLRRDRDENIKCLNKKYNLDYYSSLESNSNFELEHKCETLIYTFFILSTKNNKTIFSKLYKVYCEQLHLSYKYIYIYNLYMYCYYFTTRYLNWSEGFVIIKVLQCLVNFR